MRTAPRIAATMHSKVLREGPLSNSNVIRLEDKLSTFDLWKRSLAADLDKFESWVERNGGLSIEDSLRFYELKELLRTGGVNVAFIGEFSRGKSELINSLFFGQHAGRLMPSGIGRTTMCPVEIYFDPQEAPMLQLLPIDTRSRGMTISELRRLPVEWTKIKVSMDNPEALRKTLERLTETRAVRVDDARMLGLIPYDAPVEDESRLVDIPVWRYARLNYPHPMLAGGLRILDTPGLNALGVEPELTLSTLPSAQAIVFMLGVDTGVTASDMQVWKSQIEAKGLEKVVVINKIDLLDDPARGAANPELALERLVQETAAVLKVPLNRIFPVSALQATHARATGDAAAEEKSGVPKLEAFFSQYLIPRQQQVLVHSLNHMIGSLLEAGCEVCEKRLGENEKMAEQLAEVGRQGKEQSIRYWKSLIERKESFNEVVAAFREKRTELNRHRDRIGGLLSPTRLSIICYDALKAMEGSWTTPGLTHSMKRLVASIEAEFAGVHSACNEAAAMLNDAYAEFATKFGYKLRKAPPVGIGKYVEHLRRLIDDTESFCSDPVNVVLIEKRFMIERFWRTLVSQAEGVFQDANREAERWLAAVLLPIEIHMKTERLEIEKQVATMQKVQDEGHTIQAEIADLNAERVAIRKEMEMISGLMGRHEEPLRALARARHHAVAPQAAPALRAAAN